MGQDVKGDHSQAVKDIDQDMKDFIVEQIPDTGPKVRKGSLTGDIPGNAGISPVGPSAFSVAQYFQETFHIFMTVDVPEKVE